MRAWWCLNGSRESSPGQARPAGVAHDNLRPPISQAAKLLFAPPPSISFFNQPGYYSPPVVSACTMASRDPQHRSCLARSARASRPADQYILSVGD
ncbi:hypothetical protein RRG08_000176 [Elysia crispata]|uniref:Uncharacterized protein n=1 Tax=Elysia crispata TaxID=231223 RepID=A0AAE1D5L5_9GAST|nr:hypothetical protein RRG08_000176 [Elysia crispata]